MATCLGSSPLTRGTREKVHLLFLRTRFIPAYAGNSKQQKSEQNATTVHPRLRGELIAVPPFKQSRIGSSPLTRGTPDLIQHYEDHQRFIPAYAGNSQEQRKLPLERPVHPRLRGELFSCSVIDCMSAGSSPLTRGTQQRLSMRSIFRRFIPAYAGNSIS